MNRIVLCVLVAMMAWSSLAQARSYIVCIDENGQKIFTDNSCPSGAKFERTGKVNLKPVPLRIETTQGVAQKKVMEMLVEDAKKACERGVAGHFKANNANVSHVRARINRTKSTRTLDEMVTITLTGNSVYVSDGRRFSTGFDCQARKEFEGTEWQLEFSTDKYTLQAFSVPNRE